MVVLASNLLPSKPLQNSVSYNPSLSPYYHLSHHNCITLCISNNFKSKHHNVATSSLVIPINTTPNYPTSPQLTPNGPCKASDVLVKSLEREGVTHVFAYPGGASMEIHQSLTYSKSIMTVLPRHEQGGILASIGYARASGKPGVCIATSGPGATNLVTGLADAMADSVPIIAITGQVSRKLMGTDAFQEVAITDIVKSITKHVFLVLDPNDIPRIVKEAFFIAKMGRPGPVLIDIPKDVQQELIVPQLTKYMNIHGRPMLYIGGGCVNASTELRKFVELTGIPVASTLMGLGIISSCNNDNFNLWLGMLGMHGTICANYAVNNSDLLLAFGVRFDDRVTGKIEAFASKAKIVHIDIDCYELGKNKLPHVSVHSDIKVALQEINKILVQKQEIVVRNMNLNFSKWRNELSKQKINHPLTYKMYHNDDMIKPQYVIEVLNKLTKGNAIITTGVGQHQMFVAQYYKFKSSRQFLSSGGMGTMGFGLPAAIGASIAKPESLVIDVDGDGSFLMNIQELATIRVQNLPIKIMIINNQHLGMVVQLEDVFYRGMNHAHTFLGKSSHEGEVFPDMVKFAKACDIQGERVSKKSELSEAIKRMIEFDGPYLLDVVVPHQEHVLPMIPSGATFEGVITKKI
ncbi:ALS SURA: Acetolactate synthase 1 chloroplastic [Bienertia sinuspersici]